MILPLAEKAPGAKQALNVMYHTFYVRIFLVPQCTEQALI
jgi:hypothetical protein